MTAIAWGVLSELSADVPAHPDAPCVRSTIWTNIWTSDLRPHRQKAAALCVGCPILDACRAGAEARGERFGVWGGVDVETEYRRQYDARPKHSRRRPPCGSHNGYKAHLRNGEPTCNACRVANRTYQAAGKARRRAEARKREEHEARRARLSRRLR